MWHTHTLVFIFLGEGCIIYKHPPPKKKNTKEMEMASEYCSVASVSLGRIDSMCRCRFLMWGLWVAILPDEYLVPHRKVTWRRCIFPIGNGDFSNCHLSFPPPAWPPGSLGTTRMTMTESVVGWGEISWFLNLPALPLGIGGGQPHQALPVDGSSWKPFFVWVFRENTWKHTMKSPKSQQHESSFRVSDFSQNYMVSFFLNNCSFNYSIERSLICNW